MKITIESTETIIQLEMPRGSVPARLWVGQTESGIAVQCLVTRIAALKTEDLKQFDSELAEKPAPTPDVVAFPLRMVL